MSIRAVATLLLVTALGGPISPAYADVPNDVRADLAASGISASVSVETPQPAPSVTEDTTASLSFDQHRAFLSPDPANPLPVVKVSVSLDAGQPLSGILATPGLGPSPYTTNAWLVMQGQLSAMEALKHAIARGEALAGMELDIADAGPPGHSRALMAAPSPSDLPPQQQFASLMPIDELRTRLRPDLPVWAQAAEITVTEDAVGERVVQVSLDLPPQAFVVAVPEELSYRLDRAQLELVDDGANIGRTLVRINDSVTGDPLYVSANDAWWGFRSAWRSPLVAGFSGAPEAASSAVDKASAKARDDVEAAAGDPAGAPERARDDATGASELAAGDAKSKIDDLVP